MGAQERPSWAGAGDARSLSAPPAPDVGFLLEPERLGRGPQTLGGAMLKADKTAARQEEGAGVGTDGRGPFGALKFAHVFCTCEKEAESPRLRGKKTARS